MNRMPVIVRPGTALFYRLTLSLLLAVASVSGQTNAVDAEKAWEAFEKASPQPVPPAAWRTKRPTQEEIAKFRSQLGEHAIKAADLQRQ